MNGFIGSILTGSPRYEVVEFIAEITLKGVIVCSIAGIITLLMHRFSAYSRKMVWVAALAGLILLPALAAMTPVWNIPILPQVERLAGPFRGGPDDFSGKEVLADQSRPEGLSAAASDPSKETGFSGIHWSESVMLIWGAGAAMLALWFLFTIFAMRRITKLASDAGPLLKSRARSVSREIGLRKKVRIMVSGHVLTAITTGILNPTVILPVSAIGWPEDKSRLVLSHELAHVKRRDGIIELLAHAATLLYWFNPLVWLAAGRLRIERERDCDNAVLNCGAKPSEYASLLMDIAADLGNAARPAWEVVMISQGSKLRDRLLCILNPSVNRSTGSRKTAIVTGFLVISMIAPLSLSGIWETRAGGQEEKKKVEKKMTQEEKEKYEQEMKKKMMMKEKGVKISGKEKVEKSWAMIMEKGGDNSAAVNFAMALKKDGKDKASAVLKKMRKMEKSGDSKIYFKETEFNTLGYVFLYNKKVDEAIFVFKNNVEMYPESWNVYDSLGEGLLIAGKYDKAEKYYKKSLKMNPENENGKKMLVKLDELRKKDVATKKGT